MGIIYISGPMTGYKNFNKDSFNKVAISLRNRGFEVMNPAEFFEPPYDQRWEDYMRIAIQYLMKSSVIYMLNNWRKSKGASIEFYLANQLNMDVFFEVVDNIKPYIADDPLLGV